MALVTYDSASESEDEKIPLAAMREVSSVSVVLTSSPPVHRAATPPSATPAYYPTMSPQWPPATPGPNGASLSPEEDDEPVPSPLVRLGLLPPEPRGRPEQALQVSVFAR